MSFADGEHLAATASTHKLMTRGAGELGCYCRHTQIDDRGQELNVDEDRQKGGFQGLANTIQSQVLQSFGSLFWRVPNNTRLGGTINIFSALVGSHQWICVNALQYRAVYRLRKQHPVLSCERGREVSVFLVPAYVFEGKVVNFRATSLALLATVTRQRWQHKQLYF